MISLLIALIFVGGGFQYHSRWTTADSWWQMEAAFFVLVEDLVHSPDVHTSNYAYSWLVDYTCYA